MKKSELNTLTHVIEHLVAREVRKQLPSIIAETFQNMMGKAVVTETRQPAAKPIREAVEAPVEDEVPDFKASLKELFAGTPVMRTSQESQVQTRQIRNFSKDPKINAILNETVSDLRDRERMVGAAAFQGGYSPTLNMIPGFNPNAGAGAMMEEEPSFANNMPVMPGTLPGGIPVGRPPILQEGQVSTHAPLEALPNGLSALDVKNAIADPVLKNALTRNYSELVKAFNKKKGA